MTENVGYVYTRHIDDRKKKSLKDFIVTKWVWPQVSAKVNDFLCKHENLKSSYM